MGVRAIKTSYFFFRDEIAFTKPNFIKGKRSHLWRREDAHLMCREV